MKKILLTLMMIATMAIGQTSPTGVEAYTHPVMDLVPIAPTSLVATAGVGIVSLTWNSSLDIYGDTISDLLRYNIQRKTGVGGTWATLTTVATTSYTDSQVSTSNAYYYRVSVTDLIGQTSSYSNESNATPTTDSTAPTVPSSFAGTANGTAITVTWGASTDIGGSGVENYNGDRSLAADFSNPTSFTTTGLSFAHSGLTQNTLYYYRVRAKDYAGNYSTYATTQVTSGAISGDPVITGVSGTLTNTSVITVSGSSFGSRPVTQQIYDDMEGSTFNPSWSSTGSASSNGTRMILDTSGAQSRHQFSQHNTSANFRGFDNIEHATFAGGSNSPIWFCQYWFKLDNDWEWGTGSTQNVTPYNLANVKFFRLWTTGNSFEDFVMAAHGWQGEVIIDSSNIPGESRYIPGSPVWPNGVGYKTGWTLNTWHQFQFEWKDNSSIGISDGMIRWWMDGKLAYENLAVKTRLNDSDFKRPYGLGFFNSAGDTRTDDNHVYFDDVFMANTLARVEIGDSPTYSQCSHRELQPTVIQWTTGQIQFSMYQGSFLTGQQAYVFVVNSDGTKSVGYPITIGSGGSGIFVNNSSFTINGSGFGIKPDPVVPILWDNFENGTPGANIETSPNAWVQYGDTPVTFNSTTPYSGTRSISTIETPATSESLNSANFFFPATETIYYSYMSRIVSTGPAGGEFKSGRSNVDENLYNGPGVVAISNNLAGYWGSGADYTWVSIDFYNRSTTWKRHQIYKKNSTAGVANGEVWFSIGNRENFASQSPAITRPSGETWGGQTSIILGTMYSNSAAGSSHQTWVDDVYVDKTQMRVEVGNSSTYSACTILEIQYPTAWTDNSITIIANKGTLSSGPAWVFIINANNTVVATYPITIQ